MKRRLFLPLFPVLLFLALPLGAQVLLEHDYDPVSDAVVSWRVEPGASLRQSFTLPSGRAITAIRIKLTRWGEPLALRYTVGRSAGGSEWGAGSIEKNGISPWFEHWTELRLPRPIHGKAGERAYLELRLPASSPGAYDVYGTAPAPVNSPEFHEQFRYTATWTMPGENSSFETTANIDYGVKTPQYGEASGFAFAFQLIGETPPAPAGEERFAFIEKLTGPLYTGPARPTAWKVASSSHSPVVSIAMRELQDFLAHSPEAKGEKRIRIETGCGNPPRKSEGFAIHATADAIDVCGYDDRGAMQGAHWIEARMRLHQPPVDEAHAPRFSPRITAAPFYSRKELDIPIDPYTDGLLGRISRAGFNAIWIWCDLDAIAHSDVYPDLDHGAAARQAKLNAIVERASRYGIDVYVYLASRALPEDFFQKHPDARGSAISAYGGVAALCASHPPVLEYYRSAARNLSTSVPGIKGVAIIVGGEGFLHCYSRRLSCSRCARRTPEEVIASFSGALLEGLRAGNPGATLAIWPYSAGWSGNDPNQSRMIETMPRGTTLLTEFAKSAPATFGGISEPTYDYPISVVGPSERFVKQTELAEKSGHTLWVKTEHAIALEFIQTPYIPVFFQWAERFRRIHETAQASGVFANWMHYGFTDSRAADLFYWNIWDGAPSDPDKLLRSIASRDFGEGAAGSAVRAWRLFSEAIRQYPFSWGVAQGPIQSGPAHPLFFDPAYRPAHHYGRQFTNTLQWTRPWGPDLAVEQLRKMEQLWAAGVAELERHPETQSELGVARALLACMRSAIHVARFYSLREELRAAQDKGKARAALDAMAGVANEELRNAREVLPFIRADSRLGYANSAGNEQIGVARGGIYSPWAIEKKIAQVERMLHEEIPAYRRAQGL